MVSLARPAIQRTPGRNEPVLVAPGLFVDYIGPVQVVYLDERMTPDGFALYLSLLAEEIDGRTPRQRRGVLYVCPSPSSAMGAGQRKAVAQILESRQQQLRATTYGYVMVTPSLLVGGIVRALFWLAPPPYPNHVVARVDEGFSWLSGHIPGLDPAEAERQYDRLFARHRAALAGR